MNLEALHSNLNDVIRFGVIDTKRLGTLSHDLEEVHRELTRRLMKCEELLAQNQCLEALRIAETVTRLPGAVARYQALPHKGWKTIAQSHGLPTSLELSRKSVERLKELYARADILPHLRVLFQKSVAAEKIPDALTLLRQICARDPKSAEVGILADWERARLSQIEAAVQSGNLQRDELSALIEELRAPDWTVPPSENLIESLTRMEQQDRTLRIGELYHYHLEKLQASMDSQDLTAAQAALKYIAAIQQSTGMDLPADQRVRVATAAEQLEAQRNRQNNTVIALESMLDEQVSTRTIESRLEQAARAGVKIPGALEQRIKAHIHRTEQARWRSRRIRSMVVGFILCAIVGLGAFLFWKNSGFSHANNSFPAAVGDSPLPMARAALPDLDKYAEVLHEGAQVRRAEPEFARLAEWHSQLQGYKAVTRFGARVKAAEANLSAATSYADFQRTLGSELQELAGPTPYATLQAHYAQRQRIRDNPTTLKDVQAVLSSSALTQLQVFHELDTEGRTIATFYTGAGCAFEDAGQGNVVIPVMVNDTNNSEQKTFPKNRVSALQTPAHTALGTEIQAFLKKEMESPEWIPGFTPLFRKAVYAIEMEPFARWLLLNQLFALDAGYFGMLKTPDVTLKRLRGLNSGLMDFWLSGSNSVHSEREKLRAGLKELQPALLALVHDAEEVEREWKLALPALLRPIQLAGVVELDAQGKARPWLLKEAGSPRELWTLQVRGGETSFVIVATKTDDSNWRWVDGVTTVAGQPLLTPTDTLNSLDFWRRTAGSSPAKPVSPFPINVLAAELPTGAAL